MSGELSEQVKICFRGSTLPPGQISAIFPPVWSGLWLPHRWCFLQPVKRLWALCSASTITLICLWFQGVRCKCGYYPQDKSRLRKYLIRYKNICHQQLIWQLWPFENLKSKQFPYDEKVKLGNIKSYLFNQRLQLWSRDVSISIAVKQLERLSKKNFKKVLQRAVVNKWKTPLQVPFGE